MSTVRHGDHTHEVTILPGARKRPVGTAREAAAALCEKEPTGDFTWLGEGCGRIALLAHNGRHVYKVPVDPSPYGDGHDWQSREEFERANRHVRGYRLGLQPTSGFEVDGVFVTCQPVVTVGDDLLQDRHPRLRALKQRARELAWDLGIDDMHDGNWGIAKNGQVRIIDLGM